jgi:hypothetical protein
MDSNKFPFYQGEVYHQYHDGFFPGEDYPRFKVLLPFYFSFPFGNSLRKKIPLICHHHHLCQQQHRQQARSYNELRDRAVAEGRLRGIGCPDMVQ